MINIGKKCWLIPDAYINSKSFGNSISHDAVCVLNIGDKDAVIHLTLYFEDIEPFKGFCTICKSNRTNHIRMDKLTDTNGNCIPRDTPYAILVESNSEIVVQYSRLVTSQPEMALMTTIAYPL